MDIFILNDSYIYIYIIFKYVTNFSKIIFTIIFENIFGKYLKSIYLFFYYLLKVSFFIYPYRKYKDRSWALGMSPGHALTFGPTIMAWSLGLGFELGLRRERRIRSIFRIRGGFGPYFWAGEA